MTQQSNPVVAGDPVAAGAQPAIEHMNADHLDANLAIARQLGNVAEATSALVESIDRAGIVLLAETPTGAVRVRVDFVDGPIADAAGIRGAVVALAHAANPPGEVAP